MEYFLVDYYENGFDEISFSALSFQTRKQLINYLVT